ncbi:MAG: FIST C-terminal domain-containing protein [Planctomycetes bacterium]|nr:FIST C-terminal domain-containing protein [Planctomycetota bacterium]
MQFAHAASTEPDAADAAAQVTAAVKERLAGPVDLAVLMCTHGYRNHFGRLLAAVHGGLAPGCLVGCTAEGVFGGGREFERVPAVTLLAGSLPGVMLHPWVLEAEDLAAGDLESRLRARGLPLDGAAHSLVLLADPFTTPADALLGAIDAVCPGWAVAGGMASGGRVEGDGRLFLDDRAVESGAVGVALAGNLRMRTLVSQGCRPIGRPFVITRADRNFLLALGGRPAVECVRQVYADESEPVRRLISDGLMVGRVIDEHRDRFGRGDFLVRSVLGFDEERGAVVAGDFFRAGQTIQFHVRDAATADEDLAELLAAAREGGVPAAGLCFSCNGRGTRMFDEPNHESAAIFRALGGFPLVGHFAAGEFGGVGGRTFVHGHTLSLALFAAGE